MAKILLVEDDNNLREIYEARLQAEGYDIVSARDGEEALTVAMKERPDLIISDVMMPKISGFDMLDIIRSTEETKDAKVIMMTALSQAEDKARADKLGADRYLVKSQVTLEDVAKVAREVLEGTNKPPAPTAPQAAPTPDPVADTPAAPVSTPVAQEPVAQEPVAQPAVPPTAPVAPLAPTAQPAAEPPAVPSVAPAPEPVIVPAVSTDEPVADTPVAPINTPTPTPEPVAQPTQPVPDTSAINQSVEDEQSAIAAQIESFIDSKKTSKTTAVAEQTDSPSQQAATLPEANTTQVENQEPQKPEETAFIETPAPEFPTTKKKVIQPINDLSKSSGPDLEKLVEKENAREQMQKIAYEVAATTTTPQEQNDQQNLQTAQEMMEPTGETSNELAPEVLINDDGTLNIPEPTPSALPKTTVEMPMHQPPAEAAQSPADTQDTQAEPTTSPSSGPPVIPHTNGSSIDGFVGATGPSNTASAQAPQAPAQPPAQSNQPTPPQSNPAPSDNDPSAIAL